MQRLTSVMANLPRHLLTKSRYDKQSEWKPEMGSLYDLQCRDLDGRPYPLSQHRGQVSLVVNVASECGYTKCGYEFLQQQQSKYGSRGFTVLAFPCNQFGAQEPGDAADIRDFAVKSFHATFPLLEKTDVNGSGTHPVFRYLKQVYPGEVTWNFHGLFVINEDGIPIRRFNKEPYPEIDAFIGKALDERDRAAKPVASDASATAAVPS